MVAAALLRNSEESQAASWSFYSKIQFIFTFRKRMVGSVDRWSILADKSMEVHPLKAWWHFCSLQQRLIKAKYYK